MNVKRILLTVSLSIILLFFMGSNTFLMLKINKLSSNLKALNVRLEKTESDFKKRIFVIENKYQLIQTQFNKRAFVLEKQAREKLNAIKKLISKEQITLAKTQLNDFLKQFGQTNAARTGRNLQTKLSVVGKPMPSNWGIDRWFSGENDINLESQGTTLIVFWETWCVYCMEEAHEIQAIYEEYKKDGLQILGLTKMNKNSSPEKIEAFIKKKGIKYPIAKENGSMTQYFKVSGIPAAALLNDGKIIWRDHPARLTDEMLKKYLKIQS
ncbi:MAG: TlpA family protein disulfide reductase [Desulfobacula sp.]|uniref:TlpA family protein disulfide reductase n=1 Tax=Desulfobacula sp. TaxID=2593537 RepID=UPI0025C7199F|nr:TlpA disulfide reductase family protein [Desulfobacula sp.]MCD4719187.1 TlpA family protein disulfide reductase [Desulfobacula sp.]